MEHYNPKNNNIIAITNVLSTYYDHHKMVAYVEEAHKTNSVIIAHVYITEAIHKPTEAERRF